MKCVEPLKKETTSTNINDEQSNIFSLFEKRAHQLMIESYKLIEIKYNILITNNLLCNGKCHIVALFKEYLIDDDNSEFLRRYYTRNESIIRIKKVAKYYFETSVIFPNYTPLSEAKYIYRNIMKKQKVIDQQQELEDEKEENKKYRYQRNDSKKKVFDTIVYNDILNQSESVLRIIFGIKRQKNKNKNDNNNKNNSFENNESILEIQENIIDEINKYENNQNKSMKPQIKISETLKSKLQLKMPKRKNTPKIAITNSNIRTMLDYKKKKISKKAKSPSLTKNNNNHTHNHNNNNKSISIVSRNLTNNFTLTTNSSISTSHYKSHKTNYSMPKIYFIIQGKKNYSLHSFKSIDSNTINDNDMLQNLFNSSPRKKTHKKIRSALGRNNINNTEEKNSTCYKNKNENKRKKSFQIKKIKDMDLIFKSNFVFPEKYIGYYTDRIKK